MNFRFVLGIVLLVAAIACGWSLWSNRVIDDGPGSKSSRSNYVLNDFELISLDDKGKESFTLRAPQLRETPGAKSMELQTPLFLLPDREGRYWEVRSNTGWVSENREELRLRGKVHAQGPREDARPVDLRTEQLNLFPKTNEATSTATVNISQPGLTMQGEGLSADLDTKRFALKSQVRTRYASTH